MTTSKAAQEEQSAVSQVEVSDSVPTDSTMTAVMSAPRMSPTLSPLTTSNLQIHNTNSPPQSSGSSPASATYKRSQSPKLSLDLSNLPPLSSPAPPSNTLLITRLEDATIFHPAALATIRQHINSIAPLNSFSPLKSLARIIVSFYDDASAIKVRQEIDRTAFSSTSIAKCYFGEPTPIGDEKKFLDKPDAGRLFFISPPPSPPVGWEMKMEDPPNKEVHAEDLASQLAKLAGRIHSGEEDSSPTEEKQYTAEQLQQIKNTTSPSHRAMSSVADQIGSAPYRQRSRSSTLIYDPKVHGDSPGLPAVMLETEDDSEVELDTEFTKRPMAHTARPPVELMEE